MLIELKVSNFAIIDQIQVEFGPGLNIISGETGAGKSVIVRALGLLMGAKSAADDVREGLDQSIVEGHFDITGRDDILESLGEHGMLSDQELIVRRIISRDGKNRVYINGHLSTLADLKNIVAPLVEVTGRTSPLIEVTGQHDNRNLLSPQYHLDLLDQFCQTWDVRKKVAALFDRLQEIQEKIEKINGAANDRNQRVDFIKYQIAEIEGLDLDATADANIEERIKEMKAQQSMAQFYQQSVEALEGEGASVTYLLDKVLRQAGLLKFRPASLEKILELIDSSRKQLNEASYELGALANKGQDEDELERLESRLSDIRRLQKKFGPDLADILQSFESMRTELHELEKSDEVIAALELERKAVLTDMQPLLKNLSTKRRKGAERLIERVNEELADLNMKGVLFSIAIADLEMANSTGSDQVQFAVQNGPKGEARPLHKTASGGEMSRILLSLKLAVGKMDAPRTYLFDEVDTGVSGPTAQKVGKKLKQIAKGQQVVCITHLPQVASFADQHYFISKKTAKGRLMMAAENLTGTARVEEIARLISGEKITSTSLAHAKQLIADVR